MANNTAAEVEQLFVSVAHATMVNVAACQHAFDVLLVSPRELVARAAQVTTLRELPVAWSHGWQPSELHRQVRRATNATGAKLGLGLIANDHRDRDPASLDPRWLAQLDHLDLPKRVDDDWIVTWAANCHIDEISFVALLVDLLRSVTRLRPIAVLIPPPGVAADTSTFADLHRPLDDPMLERVRALLAKAESTEFEAEAEAFTAKAQELMARYSIDAALLSARTTNPDQPVTIRIPVDDPYADAKSLLCQIVAAHSRCRAVRLTEYGLSTIVGFASDVAATEILYTSLLVQAQAGLRSATMASGAGARTRTASFRTAFLLAYAHRVGERLEEINAYVTQQAQADIGTALVPVLAARTAAVDDAVAEQFGRIEMSRPRRGRDAAGWASGTLAANRATLHLGDLRDQSGACPSPRAAVPGAPA